MHIHTQNFHNTNLCCYFSI